jgi:hypothetical protein
MRRLTSLLLLLLLATTLAVPQGRFGPTVGGSGDFATDTFTDSTDAMNLAGHTPDLGGAWVDHPHANYTATAHLNTTTGRIYSSGTSAYSLTVTPSSANYEVEMDFCVVTSTLQGSAVTARMDTTNDTMYMGRLVDATSWQVRKIVNGTQTTLGSLSTTGVPTIGNCATGKLVVNGDQISFVVTGSGTVVGPITDTAITAAGKAGVRFSGSGSATTGTHMDNLHVRGL